MALQSATELSDLYLPNTKVSGDLMALQNALFLQDLSLTNTTVSGQLHALENATELHNVYLDDSRISGDLAGLKQAMDLEVLSAENTDISGDLQVLNMKHLNLLHLPNTSVVGHLGSLRTAIWLRSVHLSRTAVRGNLNTLEPRGCNADGGMGLCHVESLFLAETKVTGSIRTLIKMNDLEQVDLSRSAVRGKLTAAWRGCCQRLRSLKLSDSSVRLLPPPGPDRDALREIWSEGGHRFLPDLSILEVSGCPLNASVEEFLAPFLGCSALASLKAAHCGLRGAVPDLHHIKWVKRNGRFWSAWESDLARSLQTLDLSFNDISYVANIPRDAQAVILASNPPMVLAPGVLLRAVEEHIFLGLQNVRLHSVEAEQLLEDKVLQMTHHRSMSSADGSFACFDLATTSLQISPDKFLPERLCSCGPGWIGKGTECQKCPASTFKEDFQGKCKTCPAGSMAKEGSASPSACKCGLGELYNQSGNWTCACPVERALLGQACVRCHTRHLYCSSPGNRVETAEPRRGYARLKEKDHQAYKCLPPRKTRCNASAAVSGSEHPECSDGYVGILCSTCDAKYYASKTLCKPCPPSWIPEAWKNTIFISLALALLVSLAAGAWLWRRRIGAAVVPPQRRGRMEALKEQVAAQAPILLQMCQLWAVLGVSATSTSDLETEKNTEKSSFWEVPYVEALLFSVENLKGTLNLECNYDGQTVRFWSDLLAPLVPLAILLCCLALETQRGAGINAALKAITLFYIGGCASSADLMSCQGTDGGDDPLPDTFVFRKRMPYLWCFRQPETELKRYVDAVGYFCRFCYGIIIPSCLLYLYVRQQVLLQPSRTVLASSRIESEEVMTLHLHEVRGSVQPLEEEAAARRLLSFASAYVAVLKRGQVQLALVDGAVTVTSLHPGRSSTEELEALSLVGPMDIKNQVTTIRCRSISEMILERCVLQEVAPSDRVLAGARQMMLKYALCGNLWMEILLKLVAVSLISADGRKLSLLISLAITLGMAATFALVQPYLQPQVNALQCCCFSCLALSVLGFHNGWPYLSRFALLLPFLLSALQALRPDSAPSLAVRLWEELEPQLGVFRKGHKIEVRAETFSFL